jgi:ectoine hydroxylase-related dioxygenase (phytanoyl-CoA dioxygenase family)
MLTSTQLDAFAMDGFIVVPDVVPDDLLAEVDAEVDMLVATSAPEADTTGKHFYFLSPSVLPAADAALRNSPALAFAEELVAPHRLHHGLGHIQIALNIPPFEHRPGAPHIDGHRPTHSVPDSFTMLAAIYLTDETEPDRGNLWVWPGSHLTHAATFVERGTHALLEHSGHGYFLDPPIEYGDAHPVLAKRGDLLLAHFLLGHNTGGNTLGGTRRIVYFRLSCEGHSERWAETFVDPWHEYAPVRRH